MENSMTDLAKTDVKKMALAPSITTAVDIQKLSLLPTEEAGAVVDQSLEEAYKLAQVDPLAGLNALTQVMLAVDVELMRNYAPTILASAQTTSMEVALTGQKANVTQQELRGMAAFHKIQASIIKTGAAAVKINEELERREARRKQVEADQCGR